MKNFNTLAACTQSVSTSFCRVDACKIVSSEQWCWGIAGGTEGGFTGVALLVGFEDDAVAELARRVRACGHLSLIHI